MHEASFESLYRKSVHQLNTGDKIVIYYDRQNPDNAAAEMQMEREKSMGWKDIQGVKSGLLDRRDDYEEEKERLMVCWSSGSVFWNGYFHAQGRKRYPH